jgi:predicted kinase
MSVDKAVFVVVCGPPGSGKSTLATALAAELRLPLVAKDGVKEVLMAVLPPADVDASRLLGRAAIAVMFAVAARSPPGAVLDGNLYRSLAAGEIAHLPGVVVEVFCRCRRETALARYRTRVRLAGHFDDARTDEEIWNDEVTEPVAGGWPVLDLDTERPVDPAAVVAWIRRVSAADPGTPGGPGPQ